MTARKLFILWKQDQGYDNFEHRITNHKRNMIEYDNKTYFLKTGKLAGRIVFSQDKWFLCEN